MKSLDQAVQKFKILKQKLRHISQQPCKPTMVYLKNDQSGVGDHGVNNNFKINNINLCKNSNHNHAGAALGEICSSRLSNCNGSSMNNSHELKNMVLNMNKTAYISTSNTITNTASSLSQNQKIFNQDKQNNKNMQNKIENSKIRPISTNTSTNTNTNININTKKHKPKSKSIQKNSHLSINIKEKQFNFQFNDSIQSFNKFNKNNTSKINVKQNEIENNDTKDQTEKKINHKKNNSWNCHNDRVKHRDGIDYRPKFGKYQDHQQDHTQFKITSLNNSRISQHYTIDLKNRQKTLDQINTLLQKKKEVLEALQKKIGYPLEIDLENSKLDTIASRSKRIIRAPNLFQMQMEGRKRSKSKPLTIRWK